MDQIEAITQEIETIKNFIRQMETDVAALKAAQGMAEPNRHQLSQGHLLELRLHAERIEVQSQYLMDTVCRCYREAWANHGDYLAGFDRALAESLGEWRFQSITKADQRPETGQ